MKRFWARIEGRLRKEPKGVRARKLPARITINQPQAYNTFTIITTNNTMEALSSAELAASIGVVSLHVLVMRHSAKTSARGGRHNPPKGYFYWDMRSLPRVSIAAVNGFAIDGGSILRQTCNIDATKTIDRFRADEDRSEGLLRLPTSVERPEGKEE